MIVWIAYAVKQIALQSLIAVFAIKNLLQVCVGSFLAINPTV